jgi:amino acid transporter
MFLQAVTVLIGLSAFAFMLREPLLEGRNVHATFSQVYFHDAFLVYAYVASLAFYAGLYQVFRFLGFLGRNESFSPHAREPLRRLKRCATILALFVLGAEGWFMMPGRGEEDIAGGVMLGLILLILCVLVALGAARLEKFLQDGVKDGMAW